MSEAPLDSTCISQDGSPKKKKHEGIHVLAGNQVPLLVENVASYNRDQSWPLSQTGQQGRPEWPSQKRLWVRQFPTQVNPHLNSLHSH